MDIICTDFYGARHKVKIAGLRNRICAYGIYAQNKKILLVQDSQSKRWELPGGELEDQETAEIALRREFIEETGVEVAGELALLNAWTEFYYHAPSQSGWRSARSFYLIKKINQIENLLTQGNADDSIAAQFIPFEQLARLNMAPVIRRLLHAAMAA